MEVLDNYLKYLNEGFLTKASKFLGKEITSGVKASILFGLVVTPAVWLSWRAIGSSISKARRKCGTFAKGPGLKMCYARENLIIYNKKLSILNSLINKCSTSKNPILCREKLGIEIAKLKNKIEETQGILQELSENYNINENVLKTVAKAPISIGTLGFSFLVMGAADAAMKAAWRSTQAIFSQAARKCGVYKSGPERESCMSKYKLVALNKQMSILRGSSKCKNNESCQNKMEDLQRKIQLQKDNMILYKKEALVKKQELEAKRNKAFSKIDKTSGGNI